MVLLEKADVREHFDRIANVYEPRKKQFYLNIIRSEVRKLHGDRAVDLGCGSGLALTWLEAVEKVGIDLSSRLLKFGRSRGECVVGDIEESPFKAATFDLILCLDVLEHLPTLKVIQEAHRLLSKNGTFLLAAANSKYAPLLNILEKFKLKMPEGPTTWWAKRQIQNALNQAGFAFHRESRLFFMDFYRCTKS
jgi:ubiquinone/menaquinone biosynthesis C-methylase UbiE